jgi:hypothetical protein
VIRTKARVPLFIAASMVACSNGAERVALERFFEASRLRDLTALHSISTVVFEPLADGIVTRFTIIDVGTPERKSLNPRSSDLTIAERSTAGGPHSVDVSHSGAELVSEEVTLSAPVKLPDGRTAGKRLKIILQRAVVKGDREVVGRWIVTGVIAY